MVSNFILLCTSKLLEKVTSRAAKCSHNQKCTKKSLVKIYHKGHIKYAMYIDRIEAPPSPKPLFKVITLDTK